MTMFAWASPIHYEVASMRPRLIAVDDIEAGQKESIDKMIQ